MKKIIITCYFTIIGSLILFGQNCQFEESVPEEMFRGRYKESSMTYGNPYTMFNRRRDNWSLSGDIEKIRNEIIKGVNKKGDANTDYSIIYRDLYTYDTTTNQPSPCFENTECPHSKWTKNQAVIYIIGLRYSRISNRDTFTLLSNSDKNQFGARASNGLSNLNPHVISCWGGDDCGKVHLKAYELIQYLEAYDLLKSGGYLPDTDKDRNGLDCSPRSKLREFSRNLYIQSEDILNSFYGWKKNHGIICGSALCMAAIVLNDAGVEKSWGNFFLGWLWGEGTNIPRPNYSPQNWYERGYGTPTGYNIFDGEDGLRDCFFIGDHAFVPDVPQSNSEGTSGYAEGPSYYNYVLTAFLPLVRARDNFVLKESSFLGPNHTSYTNMFKWYMEIMNQDCSLPSYDNSSIGGGNLLGILGEQKYPGNANFIISSASNTDLRGDYLLAMGSGEVVHKDVYENSLSGNIIIKNTNDSTHHTFHMLAEKGVAVDKAATESDGTHEDNDLGSFMIYAGDKGATTTPLAIDPPYFGWTNETATNQFDAHNVIMFGGDGIGYFENPTYGAIINKEINPSYNIKEFTLKLGYNKWIGNVKYNDVIKRNVISVSHDHNFYYFMNDFIDASAISPVSYVHMNINGNGNSDSAYGLKSYKLEKVLGGDSLHQWTYPCKSNTSPWGLTAHVSVLNADSFGKVQSPFTNNNDYNGTKAAGVSGNFLTRLLVSQPVKKTIFQSFLLPQRCGDTLPIVTKEETADHVLTNIRFINGVDTSIQAKFGKANIPKYINDTVSHLHFTRWDGNIADSITNPFNLPSQTTSKLKLNAQKAFIINHTYGESRYGYKYCPVSSTNIKHASFSNGTYLKFKDFVIISSTKSVDASISFSGRQMYLCSIKPLVTPNSADSVKFHLADVGRGVEMLALIKGSQDTIPSRYDSLTNTIHIALPTQETTFFVQEKFNCINCYFPPNWKGIDTTFEIDDEVKHTLGHKLNIKQPKGLLKLTNSSKLDFCSGVYLNSLDSIIIEGPCQTKAYERNSCKGIDSMVAAYSDNSSITITSGSALVLGAGSYTYVKNGGAIYVKRNGSLIVKAGAFLQIGDSGTCSSGWGEIVAEPGAYIHIEPDAHVEYRRTAGDTVDRNLFLIPTQAGLDKAYEGVHYVIKSILQTDSILPDTSLPFFTYPICGLDTTCPIINKEWGYTSFGKPMAVFQAKNDTLCPGEPLHIKLNRIVNDGRYQIKVCRMDSFAVSSPLGGFTWQDTCIMDTIVQDTIPPDPICKEPRNAPEDWTYYFAPGTLHRVTISVWNDCELFDDTTAYIYAATAPDVEIAIPATACEGVGTFTANLVDHHPTPVTYAIEVTEKPDTNSIKLSKGILAKTYTQSYYGLLPSTIGFGDYFFKGGRTYLVSLTISNPCGTTSVYDSISIPLGVSITLERPTAFAQIVSGATSVKLKGYITEADSFHWEPIYWLDTATSLTPISTPLDSVTYVLVAKYGACTATDTAHIKYNRYANAGYSDTLCFDSTHSTETLVGFPYDMSLFLGMLYYYDNYQFMRYYNMYNTGNLANYFRYFTHFMHDQNFENATTPCPVNLFNVFTSTMYKELFFKKSWFKTYYQNLTLFTDPSLPALEDFVNYITSDTPLKDHLDSLDNWGNIDPCIDNLFTQYNEYVNLHSNEITTSWSRITDGDTSILANWNNYFVAIDAPVKSSKYLLSVITPSVAEIDEITILVDTLLTPLFAPAMQFDSTVYLMNYTEPVSTATHYEWNFGDGSAHSFETHPIHTFPAFDSNYVVCLIASNFCSTFTYCDTVWIDSLHLGGSLMVVERSRNKPAFFETNPNNEQVSKQATSKPINLSTYQPINLSNYPNPFNNSTIIDYEIWQNYTNAELRITNVLGQTLFTQKLNKPIDKIQVDGNSLSNGIYYYSIIIDGSVSQTRNMSVIH
ncbi:MAG: T9SS type A sorting domain-containing protein [Bacteroidia bacterium]